MDINLQLPLFTKELAECETLFEQMIYVLKNMDVLQRMPELLQSAVFKKLAGIAEVASLSKEDRIKYDADLRHFRDTLAVMDGQFLEGEKKGLAKGLAEGRAEGRAEGEKKGLAEGERIGMEKAAREMKALGLSVADIVKVTGLTAEEIERL